MPTPLDFVPLIMGDSAGMTKEQAILWNYSKKLHATSSDEQKNRFILTSPRSGLSTYQWLYRMWMQKNTISQPTPLSCSLKKSKKRLIRTLKRQCRQKRLLNWATYANLRRVAR